MDLDSAPKLEVMRVSTKLADHEVRVSVTNPYFITTTEIFLSEYRCVLRGGEGNDVIVVVSRARSF